MPEFKNARALPLTFTRRRVIYSGRVLPLPFTSQNDVPIVPAVEQYIVTLKFDALKFGLPKIINRNRSIYVFGLHDAMLGRAEIVNTSLGFSPRSWDSLTFGKTEVSPFYLLPRGIDNLRFGSATIKNLNQALRPTSWVSLSWGDAKLTAMRQVLFVRSWSALAVGRHDLSFGVRAVLVVGADNATFGLPEIGGGVRQVVPESVPFWLRYRYRGRIDWANGEAAIEFDPESSEQYEILGYGTLGIPVLGLRNQVLRVLGFDALAFGLEADAGAPVRYLSPIGFDHSGAGSAVYYYNEKIPRTWENPVPYRNEWWVQYWLSNETDFSWARGVAVLYGSRPIYTHGLNATEWGQSLVAPPVRSVLPQGFNALSISQLESQHAPHFMVGRTERYSIGGGVMTLFGQIWVRNTRQKFAFASGLYATKFGQAKISYITLFPYGFNTTEWGKACVGGGLFDGFDALEMGVAWVSLWRQVANLRGIDDLRLGMPSLHGARLFAESVATSAVFGDTVIANLKRTIYAKSPDEMSLFSAWHMVWLHTQRILPETWESFTSNKSWVSNARRFVYPESVTVSRDAVSIAWVSHKTRSIHVNGLNAIIWGQPVLSKQPLLPTLGFDTLIAGQPFISNNKRYILTGNLYAPDAGLPTIEFYARDIQLDEKGIDATLWGQVVISLAWRSVQTKGADSARLGVHWVSDWVRSIAPDGIRVLELPRPFVGGTRWISVDGFDAAEFGERIIPELQRIEFESGATIHALDFGVAWVSNDTRYILPCGFPSLTDNFGSTRFDLMRRYIAPFHDNLGGLEPPQWSGWTAIENVNRMLQPNAIQAALVSPFTTIFLNGRALNDVSLLDRATIGSHLIADRVRLILPELVNTSFVSTWLSVHNAARALAAHSWQSSMFGLPEIANRNRLIRFVGATVHDEYGLPMVADRVRYVSVFGTIAPYPLYGYTVFNTVRYIDATGWDSSRFHLIDVMHFRNEAKPKWVHRDLLGDAIVRNVTPELHAFGADSSIFGAVDVQHYRRFVTPETVETSEIGLAWIGWRTRNINLAGRDSLLFGKHRVWHLTSPVNVSRVIYPESIEYKDSKMIGLHAVRDNVIRPDGLASRQKIGEPDVWCGSVVVDLGIAYNDYGHPDVMLKRRVVLPQSVPDIVQSSKPQLSPYTIWCCPAPRQAVQNHDGKNWKEIDEHLRLYQPKGLGMPKIMLREGRYSLAMRGLNHSQFGMATIEHYRRYIHVKSMKLMRLGWVNIGDGSQKVTQFDSSDFVVIGSHSVVFPKKDDKQTIKPRGLNSLAFGTTWVSLFRQPVYPKGWDSRVFGTSRNAENGYMPQSLCVYFPKPVLPENWDSMRFGKHQISLWRRWVECSGFDALLFEYDLFDFAARMRVMRGGKTIVARTIGAYGFNGLDMGIADVSHKVRYIRPDGFMDNFRTGVANV